QQHCLRLRGSILRRLTGRTIKRVYVVLGRSAAQSLLAFCLLLSKGRMRSMIDVGKDHVGASSPGCALYSPPPVPSRRGIFWLFRFGRVSAGGHACCRYWTRKVLAAALTNLRTRSHLVHKTIALLPPSAPAILNYAS